MSSSAGNSGTVSIKYFLNKSMYQLYDGVLTFKFNGMNKSVNFLYKMEENGIRFEDATGATIDRTNTVTERGISPLVMFFSKQN